MKQKTKNVQLIFDGKILYDRTVLNTSMDIEKKHYMIADMVDVMTDELFDMEREVDMEVMDMVALD